MIGETNDAPAEIDADSAVLARTYEKINLGAGVDCRPDWLNVVVSRVRNKIEGIEEDMEFLDDHHGDLGDELREVVCGEE